MGKFQKLPELKKRTIKKGKIHNRKHGMIGVTLRNKLSLHQSTPKKSPLTGYYLKKLALRILNPLI
jgi:hypothetical protein